MRKFNLSYSVFVTSMIIAGWELTALAAPTKMKVETTAVHFEAVGKPSFIKIRGEAKEATSSKSEAEIDGAKVKGSFKFSLKELKTGIDMRDNHMKEKYLQVEKFPDAELKLTTVQLPTGWSVAKPESKDVPFEGTLKLHGVEKPIKGSIDLSKSDSKIVGAAKFEVKISEFGIDIPKYMGVTVADVVKVDVTVDLGVNN